MVKRIWILLFGLSLALTLCACSLSDQIPSLEEIVENGAEWGNEQLQQSQGWTLADLEKVWGKADGELSGMYGYFWKVNDSVSVNVYYYKNAEIEHISVSDWKDGNDTFELRETDEVQWEYTPLLSSRYPAMPFSFDVSCQEIVATCDNGTLIDFDHFDDTSESYPQGKSLTIQNTGNLYWAPHDQEEYTPAVSAEVTFTVLDENGKVLYEGILVVVRVEETTFGAIYAATLEDGSGLTLTHHNDQLGGILAQQTLNPIMGIPR